MKALVQIDLGPSVVLGSSLMVSAIALYQVRASRPEVSRDKDLSLIHISEPTRPERSGVGGVVGI